MKFRSAALLAATLLAVNTDASVVTDWNATASTAIVTNAGRNPPSSIVDFAYVNIAMYDAVNAIDGRYSVFAASPTTATAGASEEAAAIMAAYTVLRTFFPTQSTFLDGRRDASLTAIPDGDSKTRGKAIGEEVANAFLQQRAGDGRNAATTYTPGTGPGDWQPTPPAFLAPATPWVGQMRPFAMNSASQFRADPPPALGSATWIADLNETKTLGGIDSARTPEQTEIGRFYTEHTGAQYNRDLRQFAAAQNWSLPDEARLMAQLTVASADAIIAVFDSKYHYGRVRPVTFIRATDDPNWTPLTTTPNHPEYPAAHGSFTGAVAETLRQFFGTKDVPLTLSSTVTNTKRTFANTDELVKEIIVGRIYGGMHFRTSVIEGKVMGTKAAKWVAKHYFLPNSSLDLSASRNTGIDRKQ